jgi:hypothetical protein
MSAFFYAAQPFGVEFVVLTTAYIGSSVNVTQTINRELV